MAELNYYLCGGTGINVGMALIRQTNTKANKNANYVGIDSSDRNESDGMFPIVRMEGTRGSGKVKATNYPQAASFLAEVLTKYKPASFNVIVCNAAGGTGSVQATLLASKLISEGHIVFLVLATDHTSQKEFENTISTKRSFAAQTEKDRLNLPIPYIEVAQEPGVTRGEVNTKLVNQMDLLSLFATESNEEVDYEDLMSMVRYSRTCTVAPALSKISFHDEITAREYAGKPPVAVCSLFGNRDAVVPLFDGSVYRATGVYNVDNNPPKGVKEIHMIFDHGEALTELKSEMSNLDDRRVVTDNKYSQVEIVSQGSNKDGMFL